MPWAAKLFSINRAAPVLELNGLLLAPQIHRASAPAVEAGDHPVIVKWARLLHWGLAPPLLGGKITIKAFGMAVQSGSIEQEYFGCALAKGANRVAELQQAEASSQSRNYSCEVSNVLLRRDHNRRALAWPKADIDAVGRKVVVIR